MWYPQALFTAFRLATSAFCFWKKMPFAKSGVEGPSMTTFVNMWCILHIFGSTCVHTVPTYIHTYVRTYRTICTYSTVRSVHTVHTVHTVHAAHAAHTARSVHTVHTVHTVPYCTVPYCIIQAGPLIPHNRISGLYITARFINHLYMK